jgi:hypothetical protein
MPVEPLVLALPTAYPLESLDMLPHVVAVIRLSDRLQQRIRNLTPEQVEQDEAVRWITLHDFGGYAQFVEVLAHASSVALTSPSRLLI